MRSTNTTQYTELGSEQPTAVVTGTGNYYLEINNGGCPKRAYNRGKQNTKKSNLKIKQITAGAQGTPTTQHKFKVKVGDQLVADGGNNFVWMKADGTVTYGNTLRITSKDMTGAYTLKEENVPCCTD